MTIEQIKQLPKEFLLPTDIAPLIGTDPHSIRVAAREHPERLGFPVSVIGNRTFIPRRAFIRWIYGSEEDLRC